MTDDPTAPHVMEDKPIPLWQKIAATAFVVVWAALVVFWHNRARGDFWPVDRSFVGPNLVASFILFSLGLIAGALFWPPARRAIHRFADKKLAPVHEHLAVLRKHHEDSAKRQEHLIAQNAHIISSSRSISNTNADGIDLTKGPDL